MRKNEQLRAPRSSRGNNPANGNANGILGLAGNAFDFKGGDPFFGGAPFESPKMLDSKGLPFGSFLLGADGRNAADANPYFHGNGVPPNLMGLNSLLSMAAMPNYFANPELLNLFMRAQLEPKAFKDLPEQIFNNCNGLLNSEEFEKQLLKNNKTLFENPDQSFRKLVQQLMSTQTASKLQTELNASPTQMVANLQNDQNHSNSTNGSAANNISTSFLNLSKMSDLDLSNVSMKRDAEPALVNGNSKKPETPAKNGPAGNEAKSSETNGKSSVASVKVESDEESQRDSSSLDEEMLMSDGKKVRVRSVLSEETLRVLRAQYAVNPRPKKQEILRLSEQVNYSPRVVQVWFQNMRYVYDMSACLPLHSLHGRMPAPSTSFLVHNAFILAHRTVSHLVSLTTVFPPGTDVERAIGVWVDPSKA